jgi:RHS repeat-associated protein
MSETFKNNPMKQYLRSLVTSTLFLLSFTISAAPVYADNFVSEEGDAMCWDGSSDSSGKGTVGKPVSLFTGSETLTKTDLSLGSIYPMTIQRRYNSTSAYDSPLGYGWALNYDKRLYTYPDGSVIVRKDCGKKLRFTWSAGGFMPPAGEYGTLVLNADGTYIYTDKDGSKQNYDLQGRLAGLVDSKGNSLVLTYLADYRSPLTGLLFSNLNLTNPLIVSYDYRLSKVEEKDATGALTGASVTFSYDTSTGRLNGIWDSTGRSVIYSHDNIGNLTGVSGPSGSSTYGYSDPNNMHHVTTIDEGKGQYVNTHDAQGRVIKQSHGTGVIDIEYLEPNKKNRVTTSVKDADGNALNTQVRIVEFDDRGMVVKITDTFNNTTTYARDSSSQILQEMHTDVASGITTTTAYTYDAKGNTLTKTEAQGTAIEKTTTYTYDPIFSRMLTETLASVVDAAQNKVTTNTYDSTGNLLTTTEAGLLGDGTPYSYTTTYTYDALGRIATIDGPRTDVSDVTTYYYDPLTGYRNGINQPLIGTTAYSNFDSLGNPQTITDPNGNSSTYTYDTIGRVSTVKAPGDTNATQYFYVAGGCQSCGGMNKIDHITLPEGNTIWYSYDSMGNLSTITDSLNNTINYTYDSEGNKLTEQIKDSTGTLQKSLSYSYDALNRLSKITNPDGTYTLYGYDAGNNRTSLRTPNAQTVTYTYDALNRLTSTLQPLNASTTYGYDSNNNLASVKDANNNTTTYKYDDKGRVYQVISPDTGTTTYSYDPAGNTISKTDAKTVAISYVYDELNRLTKSDFPTDTDIVYAYDSCVNGKGRLCSMTDASGTTGYEYTPKGQVKKETKTIDSVQYITQYSFDMNGNMKTMTYPSGKVITYNYTNDRAISVLNGAAMIATNINYKPFGGMSSITYGNGIAGSISYDNQYRVSGITAGAVMNLSYPSYDANGNIQSITNNLDPTKNKTFTYDTLDRLSTAAASGIWGSLGWTYDGVGNRQTENSNSYTYALNTNKLTSANAISFGYDNNGNATTEGSKQYIYNQNQRLIQVNNGGTIAYYTYNGNGQRAKKTVDGSTTIFHYGLSGQLIAESDSAGNVSAEYVYLNSQPLAKMEGANTYYYHNDHLATPQKMTDSSGAVVWSADYKPFGEATITVSTVTNNLRFPGQYFDSETGLHYNYYRDYNPAIGRYLEPDPLLLPFVRNTETYFLVSAFAMTPGRLHAYLYVGNNPVNWIDSKGLIQSSGSGPSNYPGSAVASGQLNNASGLIDFNMGDRNVTWGFKDVCVKESCNTTCSSDKGPWLTNKDSKKCVCVEWKRVFYEW